MNRMTLRRRAALLLAPVVAATLSLVAAPASAHVTVSSTDAAQGGFGKATFRVPNESDTAATTKLVVTLPIDQPFAYLTVAAKPGWTVEVTKEKLPEPVDNGSTTLTEAVRTVTWTASGDGIAVGQFDEFAISGGPFPESDDIVFAAQQTYADGEVVDWADVSEGDEEAEHPAPTLALSEATGDAHGAAVDTEIEPASAVTEADDTDDVARVVAAVAVVVAIASLIVAVRQNRRRA